MSRACILTIPVDVRDVREDDVKIKVWTGTVWKYLDWGPFSPDLAAKTKTEAHSYRVKVEFLPPNVKKMDQLRYRKGLLVAMRKIGVLR